MNTLFGFAFKDWWKLLKQNKFEVDRGYRRRVLMITIASLFNSIGRRKEMKQFGSQIKDTEIKQPPIFILGHWRSGTTLLHNLMTVDKQFAYPTLFEVSNPHVFLSREDKFVERFKNAPTHKRAMDNVEVGFQSPAEDEFALLLLSLESPNIGWMFPRSESYYDRYLNFKGVFEDEIRIWKTAFQFFLKKLTLKHQKQLILKSPGHTSRIKVLLELFPDAKFVHIRRNPFQVFQSTMKLYQKNVPLANLQKPNWDMIKKNIIRRYAMMYETYFDDKSLIQENQLVEIAFEEFEQDKISYIRKIYDHFNLSGFDQAIPKLRQYLEKNRNYKKNVYSSLDKATTQQLVDRWERCFDEWGYPKEPRN